MKAEQITIRISKKAKPHTFLRILQVFLGILLATSIAASSEDAYADELVQRFAKVLPKSKREGLEEYLALIGQEATGYANYGFRNFNEITLHKNPCFQSLAARFYASIQIQDIKRLTNSKGSFSPIGKPNLTQTVRNIGLKPGWLWDKALSYSGGNKSLAMRLIGVCGHDDTNQEAESGMSLDKKAAGQPELHISEADLNAAADNIWNHLSPAAREKLSMGKIGVVSDYKLFSRDHDASFGVKCPNAASAMYYPESLGAQADIDTNLKKRISEIQAPTLGPEVIPSKYYHVIGEAFAACRLTEHGIPNVISKLIVSGAINAYRAGRLCDKVWGIKETPSEKGISKAIEQVNATEAPPEKSFPKLIEEIKEARANEERCLKEADPPSYCTVSDVFGWDLINETDDTQMEKRAKRALAEYDAANMIKNTSSLALAGHCKGPQYSSLLRTYLETNSYNRKTDFLRSPCAKELSPERCEAARKVMDTYLVDFEWSEAQHLAGLQFAQANCSDKKENKDFEKLACERVALDWKSLEPKSSNSLGYREHGGEKSTSAR